MRKPLIRRVTFKPYLEGHGPIFRLSLYDTSSGLLRGRSYLAYVLTADGVPIFQGNDYSPAPSHAIDSDDSIEGLMAFLTLRIGDTDEEYFKDYSPAQLEFTEQHAEQLACEVMAWHEERNKHNANH